MDKLLIGFGGGLLLALAAGVAWRLARRGRRREAAASVTYESFITSMKAVGELSVFRIMTKEVITASDHWFGEFGKKYLNWLLSSQRITLVIEFDVDFRYDLTDPAFRVERRGEGAFLMRHAPLPPRGADPRHAHPQRGQGRAAALADARPAGPLLHRRLHASRPRTS